VSADEESSTPTVVVLVENGGERAAPLAGVVRASIEAALAKLAANGRVTIVLTSNDTVRELNRDYRGQDTVTDVLSFQAAPGATEPGDLPYLGDVVIAVPLAEEQAAALSHDLQAELRLLAVHGLLHLLGYDDSADASAEEMEALEAELGVR
jgi:probable rRNA maturation factor